MMTNENYISLKEAAELSGYSADYVGQLIRKGKLPGKQVYKTVAWMTTRQALLAYVAQEKRHDHEVTGQERFGDRVRKIATAFRTEAGVLKLLNMTLWVAAVILGVFALLLFYTFSVRFDKKLQDDAAERLRNIPSVEHLR